MSAHPEEDESPNILTVETFREHVKDGFLIDYDGFGEAMTDAKTYVTPRLTISPSGVDKIPQYVTHIHWYNR